MGKENLDDWSGLADSDLDDAPEEVTLEAAQLSHKQLKRQHEKEAINAKLNKKHKNKQRNEVFKAQKEAKLAKLEATRLPDDVLDDLSDSDDNKDKPNLSTTAAQRTMFDSDDEVDKDSGIDSAVTSKVSVKVVRELKMSAFKAAADFKKIKESGAHTHINRISAKERQLMNEKKKAFRSKR